MFSIFLSYNRQNKERKHIGYSFSQSLSHSLSLVSSFLSLSLPHFTFSLSLLPPLCLALSHTQTHMQAFTHTHHIGLVYFKTLLENSEINSFTSATTFHQMVKLYNQIQQAFCMEIRFYSVLHHLTIQIVCKPNLIKSKDIYSMLCSFMQKYCQLFKKPNKMLPQVLPRSYHEKQSSYFLFKQSQKLWNMFSGLQNVHSDCTVG